MTDRPLGFDTLAIHAGADPDPATGARQIPIYQTTAYVFKDADHAARLFNLQEVGWIYSRLTNPTVGALQARIAEPKHKTAKTYWAQVEGVPDEATLTQLRHGVDLGGFVTAPAQVRLLAAEEVAVLWPRQPPIRVRQTVPDFWLALQITEGKNRQVRRMTAKVGYPCLRLVRVAVGGLNLFELGLGLGQWQYSRQRP